MQGQTHNQVISKESLVEDEKPIPPRFWWLKRGATGFGLLLAMLCVLRFWWGHEAQRRIEAVAREAHARGEPFYFPQDFLPAPVPDADNAGVPIEAAARRLQADGYEIPSQSFDMPEFFGWHSYVRVDQPSPGELPELKAYIRRYENALRLVRSARGRSKVVFSERVGGSPLPSSMYFGPIGQLLVTAANNDHATADDRQAVEYAHDALVLVDALKCARSGGIWAPSKLDCETTDLLGRISLEISISNTAGKQTSPQPYDR